MRLAPAVLLLALSLSAWAQPVAACEGGDAPLATGIRGASSIFYARIVADKESSLGFHSTELRVGRVLRGRGRSHVSHLITPRACDQLAVGDFGVVVIGSVNPYGVGPNDIYNFFYVLGPGHTSASAAARVLSDLPATDTAASVSGRGSSPEGWLVALIAAVSFGVTVRSLALRTHRRGRWEDVRLSPRQVRAPESSSGADDLIQKPGSATAASCFSGGAYHP
jgi:hypothetical protein